MAITLESLELGAVDTGELIQESLKTNAFAKAGRLLSELPPEGQKLTKVGGFQATQITEGGEKLASGVASSVFIGTNLVQVSTVQTLQFFARKKGVTDVIYNQFPSATANLVTLITAGVVAPLADWNGFDTFADPEIEDHEVLTGSDASVSLDVAGAMIDGMLNAYVISNKMYNFLRSQRHASGARVFEFTGDINEGTIDGIPYYTFKSNEVIGFAGDWTHYRYGAETFTNPVNDTSFTLQDQGNVEDLDGVVHNLNYNKMALRYEQYVASGITNKAAFVRLVVNSGS